MIRSRLQEVLDARGLTAYALATHTGLRSTVYRFVDPVMASGMPRREHLDVICAALRVPVGDLLVWEAGDESVEPLLTSSRPRGRPKSASPKRPPIGRRNRGAKPGR